MVLYKCNFWNAAEERHKKVLMRKKLAKVRGDWGVWKVICVGQVIYLVCLVFQCSFHVFGAGPAGTWWSSIQRTLPGFSCFASIQRPGPCCSMSHGPSWYTADSDIALRHLNGRYCNSTDGWGTFWDYEPDLLNSSDSSFKSHSPLGHVQKARDMFAYGDTWEERQSRRRLEEPELFGGMGGRFRGMRCLAHSEIKGWKILSEETLLSIWTHLKKAEKVCVTQHTPPAGFVFSIICTWEGVPEYRIHIFLLWGSSGLERVFDAQLDSGFWKTSWGEGKALNKEGPILSIVSYESLLGWRYGADKLWLALSCSQLLMQPATPDSRYYLLASVFLMCEKVWH